MLIKSLPSAGLMESYEASVDPSRGGYIGIPRSGGPVQCLQMHVMSCFGLAVTVFDFRSNPVELTSKR